MRLVKAKVVETERVVRQQHGNKATIEELGKQELNEGLDRAG